MMILHYHGWEGVVFMFEDPLTELTFTIILIMLILTMIWLIL